MQSRVEGRAKHVEADVAVVGGGLAGLMAARVIAAAGLQPVVIEARSRIGGRVLGEPIGDGAILEMGGQYVGHRDQRLRALLTELDIDTFAVYDRGLHLLELGRGMRRYRGNVPHVGARTLLDLARARWRIDRCSKRVPTIAPWDAPHAREWDRTTFATWLEENVRTRDARSFLDAAVATIWGEDPHGVNMLAALAFVNMAGSFQALGATRGGLLQDRVVGGSGRLPQTIAAELEDNRILYDCPVDAIVDHGGRVDIESAHTRVTARHAILALPPVLARAIRFEPVLPALRLQALESLPMGSVIKIAAVYERPFWRERGLSGRALSVNGPVTATLDNSPPDGRPGVLIGFVPGARARQLAERSSGERREAVLATFERLFGHEAARPEQYLEKDWTADQWSRGCYFGLAAPGALTGPLSTLAHPTGSIHWAGSETAFESFGGMDGALRSGERAANEVLTAMASATVAAH
ncbi:MAG: flavin monoamine oxidase family protein [Solirubrobacterales bacterium]